MAFLGSVVFVAIKVMLFKGQIVTTGSFPCRPISFQYFLDGFVSPFNEDLIVILFFKDISGTERLATNFYAYCNRFLLGG